MTLLSLARLRDFARELYGDGAVDLPHLVSALAARCSEDPGLEHALRESGLDAETAADAMAPFYSLLDAGDRHIVEQCVVTSPDGVPTARDLLVCLIADEDHRLTRSLVEAGLNRKRLLAALSPARKRTETLLTGISGADIPGNALERFGRDLTLAARAGEFDALADRPAEIAKLLTVLLRRTKRNPILTGPAGVGKTALVELFAREVARGNIKALAGHTIVELSAGELVAGTRYRGDTEERIMKVAGALDQQPKTIVFMDEIHLLVGLGAADRVHTDAANLLKPFLARGGIHLIGATTTEEYARFIRPDAALERRFEQVRLTPPDDETCFVLTRAQADALEKHHHRSIPDAQVREAIALTNRYLPNTSQPDAAITLLDTTLARCALHANELSQLTLLECLADRTGKPIAMLDERERAALAGLGARLRERIVGQDDAIDAIVDTLQYRRQDLTAAKRPLAAFLFAGDKGVGKTELARALAAEMFGGEDAMLRVDLGESSEKSAVSTLLGAPPGYRDSDTSQGTLIRFLEDHAGGLLLFDEAEKASVEVKQLLLALTERGTIASARGRTYDASQYAIVLTTNAARSAELKRRPVGFSGSSVGCNPREILKQHFPDELLDRLDGIVVFNALGPRELHRIVALELLRLSPVFLRKNVHLLDEPASVAECLAASLGACTSARDALRVVEREVLRPLGAALLSSTGGPIAVSFDAAGQIRIVAGENRPELTLA